MLLFIWPHPCCVLLIFLVHNHFFLPFSLSIFLFFGPSPLFFLLLQVIEVSSLPAALPLLLTVSPSEHSS